MTSRLAGALNFTLVNVLLPKLDPKKRQLGATITRWPLSLLTIYGRASTEAGPWEVLVRGYNPKMAFKSSKHLWSCWYPSWTLKGVSWASRSQDGLQIFSPLVVVPVPKLDPESHQLGVMTPRWPSSLLTVCDRASTQTLKDVSWGSQSQDAL